MEQPVRKQIDGAKRHETATGIFWLPTDVPGDVIVQNITEGLIFEKQILDAVLNEITPGSIAIDVGPCYGQMSVLMSKKAKQVIAVEASPKIYEICKRNLEENSADNVRLIHAAAWDKADEKLHFMDYEFSHYKSYGCFGIDPAGNGKVVVETITLDSLRISEHVSVMKIDAQGSDLKVMKGAAELIAKNKPTIVFEYEDKYNETFESSWEDHSAFFDRIGYRVHDRINDNNIVLKPQ